MTNQFDPRELMRLVEEARRAMNQFDPRELTRLADEARRGADEARRTLEQFDPTELTRLADEVPSLGGTVRPEGVDAAGSTRRAAGRNSRPTRPAVR